MRVKSANAAREILTRLDELITWSRMKFNAKKSKSCRERDPFFHRWRRYIYRERTTNKEPGHVVQKQIERSKSRRGNSQLGGALS